MRKRYLQDKSGKLIEVDNTSRFHANWQVMKDIQPYQSMIDGSIISSRSRHREHLRAHGCEEIGNDSSLYRERRPIASPPGLKETLIQAANQCLKEKK